MKRFLVLAGCLFTLTCACFAQDVIVTRDSRKINAIVTQVNASDVRFKYFDNPNGSTYMLKKSDIVTIIYENGNIETFGTESVRTQTATPAPVQSQSQRTTQPQQYQSQSQRATQTNPYQTQNQRIIQPNQYGQYQDVVYLKNGSIIRGVIIEQVPNRSVKMETADGNIFVFQMDDIEVLTKMPYRNRSSNSLNSMNSNFLNSTGSGLQRGFKGIVELGYLFSSGDNGIDRFKLNFIAGYQTNPYFSFGFGIGLRNYSDNVVVFRQHPNGNVISYKYDVKKALIPILADFRVNFTDNWISPYVSLGFGYSFNTLSELNGSGSYGYTYLTKLKGGFLVSPTAGFSFKLNGFAMHAGLEYEIQRLGVELSDDNWNDYDSFSVNSGAIGFVIGLSF